MFVIEDTAHCESFGRYESFELALDEIKRLATIPWNKKPIKAPCSEWKNCGRFFEIVEYDMSVTPWICKGRKAVLESTSKGLCWAEKFTE